MPARQKAAMHQIYSEDERRMQFFALLCGREASKQNNDVRNNNGINAFPSQLMSRERIGSIGGMGMIGENKSGKGASAAAWREKVGDIKSLGKGAGGVGLSGGITSHAQKGPQQQSALSSDSNNNSANTMTTTTTPINYRDLPLNYQPTTPTTLSGIGAGRGIPRQTIGGVQSLIEGAEETKEASPKGIEGEGRVAIRLPSDSNNNSATTMTTTTIGPPRPPPSCGASSTKPEWATLTIPSR